MDTLSTSPLSIAVVTETYPPEVNGVARTIGMMVESMHLRGHRIQLVRPRQNKSDQGDPNKGIETLLKAGIPIPKYQDLRMGLPCAGALVDAWRKRRPDIVQVVTEGPLGASALKAAKKLNIPVVSEFRTNFHSYSKHYGLGLFKPLVAGYLKRFHNRSDRTLVPTAQMKRQLDAQGYLNLSVVGRGIDLSIFNPSYRSTDLRRQWGAAEDDLVVLYVGRLAPEKNFPLFVEATRAMLAVTKRLRVVVVGDGPDRSAMAAAHPDFVFAGMRGGIDLAAHYASADVFLFPSQTETFGNVTTEAMASGLSIVAYDYAAARQHIRHRENGLLAPYQDAAQFVQLAQEMTADSRLRRQLGLGAAQSALALTWPRIIDELENVFYELSRQSTPLVAQGVV